MLWQDSPHSLTLLFHLLEWCETGCLSLQVKFRTIYFAHCHTCYSWIDDTASIYFCLNNRSLKIKHTIRYSSNRLCLTQTHTYVCDVLFALFVTNSSIYFVETRHSVLAKEKQWRLGFISDMYSLTWLAISILGLLDNTVCVCVGDILQIFVHRLELKGWLVDQQQIHQQLFLAI